VASNKGIARATREVVERARSVAKLQVELAIQEIKRKLAKIGLGLGLAAGAAVVALYAVGFLFAAAAAGLATTIPLWASLLIVGVVLIMITCLLLALAIRSFKAGSPPVPTQAIEEAKTTTETVTNALG
jgi:Putative Actinobacterial Holin-X, holin superfamily III